MTPPSPTRPGRWLRRAQRPSLCRRTTACRQSAPTQASCRRSTDESKALDGISHNYFPLTAVEQAKYNFSLEGTETIRGRAVYRIRFEPKLRDRHNLGSLNLDFDVESGGAAWKGGALIDAAEYQPIS